MNKGILFLVGETDAINGLEKNQDAQDQEIPPPPARPAPVRPAPSKPAVSPPLVAKTKAQPANAKDDEPPEVRNDSKGYLIINFSP